jgi:transcriptional regulator with GAF, ATPase, and Fis domain
MLNMVSAPTSTERLIGTSAAVRAIDEDINLAARSDAKVLITGETGVGKEVIATLIHQRSARRLARLVTINCAGVPDSLLESELFGHVRGSFTGAYRDKPGILESADKGTVFLDEVGEMSLHMQAALLRFLETGELQRVGADRVHARVNVRILAATNRDFAAHIASGAFRQDLYYRLNVIHIQMPPLRERREDIPVLLDHFINSSSREYGVARPAVTPEAVEVLTAYDWPGNVRQLKNVVERIVLKQAASGVTLRDLPSEVVPSRVSAIAGRPDSGDTNDAASARKLAASMMEGGQSFWTAVHPHFMNRDLCRSTLRALIALGLEQTSGNYRILVERFNMPTTDYKRFLAFLRKHDCLLRFHAFRVPSQRQPLGGCPESRPHQGVAA